MFSDGNLGPDALIQEIRVKGKQLLFPESVLKLKNGTSAWINNKFFWQKNNTNVDN